MKKLILCLSFLVWISAGFAQLSSTSYSGSIEGYAPSLEYTTGKLIVHNVVTGIDELYIIEIDPEGGFSVDFPLRGAKECYISFPFFSGYVYFEPGDRVVQNFVVSGHQLISSNFSGNQEAVNNSLFKVRDIINHLNWSETFEIIWDMEPKAYKAYFKGKEAYTLGQLSQLKADGILSAKAHQLARNTVQYNTAIQLMSYNWNRESAYRRMHKFSADSRAPVLKEAKLETSYYDFLDSLDYNDPKNLESGYYGVFLNRLKYIEPIYERAGVHDLNVEIEHLESQDSLSEDLADRLAWLKEGVKINRKVTTTGSLEKARLVVLKSLINGNISLELEVMDLQDICQEVDLNKTPLPDSTLVTLKSKLENEFLLGYVQDLNGSVREAINKSSNKTGFINNSAPIVGSDSVFNNIIRKYKGKVAFVDFWATWCGPCLAGIREMTSIKDSLQKEGVVFLYITDNTSPLNAYNTLIPGIKGEHYRVSNDQFNRLSAQFSISGIPHYALVNRDGLVVNPNYKWQNAGQVKNILLKLLK